MTERLLPDKERQITAAFESPDERAQRTIEALKNPWVGAAEPDKQALENQWGQNWQPTEQLKALATQVTTVINDASLTETEKQAKVYGLITAQQETKD
jgi:hypothetical protein